MILVAVSVFDSKVGAFAVPFFYRSRPEAIRAFETACRDEKSPFGMHPGDFGLFVIGEFDDSVGLLQPAPQPYRLCGADDFVLKVVHEK